MLTLNVTKKIDFHNNQISKFVYRNFRSYEQHSYHPQSHRKLPLKATVVMKICEQLLFGPALAIDKIKDRHLNVDI